ncbi:MAG: AAA family ATPase [Sterolibacterium sp.]
MNGAEYTGLIGPVARELCGEPNAKLSSKDELRFGTNGSLSVDLQKDTWYDHEAEEGGGVLDLVSRSTGRPDGKAWLIERGYTLPAAQPSEIAYDYTDERGAVLFQVVRKPGHKFMQRRPDPNGGWIWQVKGVRPVPYRLPQLLGADPSAEVYVVEGEKDADRMASLGLIATCNAGGAGKWRAAHAEYLRGRNVTIIPDNDKAGADHAATVAATLEAVAARVRVLDLPGLPAKGDVSDWLDAGGTVDALEALASDAGTPSGDGGLWAPSALDRFTFDEITKDPEPIPFVVYPYLPAAGAAVLTGAGGTNKTGFLTLQAVHICTGQPLFGEAVQAGQVLFVSAEDRRDLLRSHVWAHVRDLPPFQRQKVADNFIVKDAVGLGFKLTRHIEGQTVVAPDVDGLVQFALTLPRLRLVILDTLSRLNGGTEENDDLARMVEAMESIARATGAAVILSHHTGKAQMRDGVVDQYSSRGGSSLSDNARSVMHLHRIVKGDANTPDNAAELIAQGRLTRLSHVKSNYAAAAPDRYIERCLTPFVAHLVPFVPQFGADATATIWQHIEAWFTTQTQVPHPVQSTIDTLSDAIGSRQRRRDAIAWALDRGLLLELPHPTPQGRRKTYYALPSQRAAA